MDVWILACSKIALAGIHLTLAPSQNETFLQTVLNGKDDTLLLRTNKKTVQDLSFFYAVRCGCRNRT